MSVGVRCFECKLELKGSGTGIQHATLTGHTWEPGYYCTACEAMFSKHSECEQHIGVHYRRGYTQSSTPTHMYRSSSSRGSNQPLQALTPVGRVPPVGVVAPKLGGMPSGVAPTTTKVRVRCTSNFTKDKPYVLS